MVFEAEHFQLWTTYAILLWTIYAIHILKMDKFQKSLVWQSYQGGKEHCWIEIISTSVKAPLTGWLHDTHRVKKLSCRHLPTCRVTLEHLLSRVWRIRLQLSSFRFPRRLFSAGKNKMIFICLMALVKKKLQIVTWKTEMTEDIRLPLWLSRHRLLFKFHSKRIKDSKRRQRTAPF